MAKPLKQKKENKATDLEEFFKATKEVYLKNGEIITTVVIGADWLVTPDKGGMISIQLGNVATEKRFAVLQSLGAAAQVANKFGVLGKVKFVGMSSEGWMSTQNTKEKKITKPSEDINKKEVLITSISYKKGEVETKVAEIKKHFDGESIVTTVTETKEWNNGVSQSPLIDGFWKTLGGKGLPVIPKSFQDLAKRDPQGVLNMVLDEAMRVSER